MITTKVTWGVEQHAPNHPPQLVAAEYATERLATELCNSLNRNIHQVTGDGTTYHVVRIITYRITNIMEEK